MTVRIRISYGGRDNPRSKSHLGRMSSLTEIFSYKNFYGDLLIDYPSEISLWLKLDEILGTYGNLFSYG